MDAMNFTYFSSQILENCSTVNGSGGTNASMACCTVFQMPMNSSNWKLHTQNTKHIEIRKSFDKNNECLKKKTAYIAMAEQKISG